MDFLSACGMPWLASAQQRIRAAQAMDRLPQSLLVLSVPGLGAEQLASWVSAFVLCESPLARPCAACAACRLLAADSHPDLHVVRLEEKAQQIKIEQVRDLIEALALKSYRGGYKIGVIEDAETLNTHSANAFLKTLEEPFPQTLLIMIARPSHRLPATIASRCVRLVLSAPDLKIGSEWLESHAPAQQPWSAALQLAAGAPLRALQFDAGALAELDRDMQLCVRKLGAGEVDVTLLAEQWLRSSPELRIAWLENWITRRVVGCLGKADSRQSAEPVSLPAALLKPKITPLFELLDATRDFRRLASTGMNQQLALEALLVSGRAALTA